MSSTISVLVQTNYELFDDLGQLLAPDGTIYQVQDTPRIEEYINTGQLVTIAQDPTPAPASAEVQTEESKNTPKPKARVNVQEQENSNG
jgi:hypothetical protein